MYGNGRWNVYNQYTWLFVGEQGGVKVSHESGTNQKNGRVGRDWGSDAPPGLSLLASIALLLSALMLVEKKYDKQRCRAIKICLRQIGEQRFVTEQELISYLKEQSDVVLDESLLHQIKITKLENTIKSHNFVRACSVHKTWQGDIKINITPKEVLARVVCSDGGDCYIDEEGALLPLSKSYTARVLLFDGVDGGHLKHIDQQGRLNNQSLLEALRFLNNDPFWKAHITHVGANKKGELTLTTLLNRQKIHLGAPHDIKNKMKKLMLFYQTILPQKGWHTYKRINLKFDNQIVVALVGKKNDRGTIDILGWGKAVSEGVVRGIITNLDKTVVAIQDAIKQAEERSGIDIRVVNVGIAGRHTKSSVYHGSITREWGDEEITIADVKRLTNDMYKILLPPGSEIIHVMPQDYMVDYEAGVKDPVGMNGVRLEADFHIITAPTSIINNVHKCIKRAGLEVAALTLEPIASSLSTLSEEEKEAGVCLVDIGGGTIEIAIFYDSIIRHTTVIPFGGNAITADIKTGFQIMEHQAELLKQQFGKALVEEAAQGEVVSIPGLRNRPPKEVSVRNLAQVIEARMEEIIEMVHTEIILSGFHNKLAAGIVITGGGAQLQSLNKLCRYITGMDIRIGYPNELLSENQPEELKNPMYATGAGLVLAGFTEVDERENVYRHENQVRKNQVKAGVKKEKPSIDLFRRLLHKTKGLLIDDYDGQSN
eukprot:gene3044-3808_t